MKQISEFFLSEILQSLEVKCSIYLNRRVFVKSVRGATDCAMEPGKMN